MSELLALSDEISLSSSDVADSDAVEEYRMIGIAEVRRMMAGMSVKQIDRLVVAGHFPAPTFISPNRRAWRLKAVVAFLQERESVGQNKRAYSTHKKAQGSRRPEAVSVEIIGNDCCIPVKGSPSAKAAQFSDDEIPY